MRGFANRLIGETNDQRAIVLMHPGWVVARGARVTQRNWAAGERYCGVLVVVFFASRVIVFRAI